MAFAQIPANQYLRTIDTGETPTACGVRSTLYSFQLAHIVATMYRVGAPASGERVRLLVCHDFTLSKEYARSDWVSVETFYEQLDPGVGEAAFGRVRFDFTRLHIDIDQTYYLALETDAYTDGGSSDHLAFKLDWPDTVYEQEDAPRYGWQVELYGYHRFQGGRAMPNGQVEALTFIDGVAVTAGTPTPSVRYSDDKVWAGETTQTFDVSASVTDARVLDWSIKDNANNYMQVLAEIDSPTATTVRVTVGIALTGTYRLVGV